MTADACEDATVLEWEAALAFGDCEDDGDGATDCGAAEGHVEGGNATAEGDAVAEASGDLLEDGNASAEGNAIAEGRSVEDGGKNDGAKANLVGADVAAEENTMDAEPPAAASAGPKKVKLKKTITDRIRRLNEEANLPAPVRLSAVAVPLAALDEEAAIEVLDSLLEEREEDIDPTAWVVAAAKQRQVWSAWEKEQWEQWEAHEEAGAADRGGVLEPKVLEKIRQLNRGGTLCEPLRVQLIAGALALVSPNVALHILGQLEAKATDIEFPSGFVKGRALHRTSKVMAQVEALNKGGAGRMDLINPIIPARVRGPLMLVTDEVGMELLQELEANAMDIVEPTEWIVKKVEQHATPVAKKLVCVLDDVRTMAALAKLHAGDALALLETLSEPDALKILERLAKNAENIRSPHHWLRSQVAMQQERANKGKKGKGKVNGKGIDKGKDKVKPTGKEKGKGKSNEKSKGKGNKDKGKVLKDAPATKNDDDWSEDDLPGQTKADQSKVKQASGGPPKTKRPTQEPSTEDWPDIEEEFDEDAMVEPPSVKQPKEGQPKTKRPKLEPPTEDWPNVEEEFDEDAQVEESPPCTKLDKEEAAPTCEDYGDGEDYADGEDDGE